MKNTISWVERRSWSFKLICILALLHGCGGGGGSNSTAEGSAASVTSAQQPVPAASSASGDDSAAPVVKLPALDGTPGLSSLPTTALAPSPAAAVDTTVAPPTIQAIANGPWASASTWSPNRVPAENDVVSIPKAFTVDLASASARLGGLWVFGKLNLADADGVLLNTRFTVITGTLQAGSESQPVTRQVAIELWGTDVRHAVAGMGTKNLAVMGGGMLKLHGQPRLAWTKLDASVSAGATRLTLKDSASTWRAGDKLILASGSIDPRDAQELTVTAVNGKQIDVSPALGKPRYAQVQTYDGKTLDQRPAIGLLSRNLVVRGAADSDGSAFGGHVMVMAGGHAQVSGVELQRMGQRGLPGRYPIHWHEASDRTGSYAIGNSITSSFQRAIVVHSSSHVMVDANVAYNVPNHAFVWAEDGDEVGNIFTRNLGILVRTPQEQHFAFPINNPFFGNSSQGEGRSAVFWGRSMTRHVLRDNISAGSLDGFGYFVDLFTPAPDSAVDGSGMIFDGNIAHSTYKTLATGNQINYPEATTGHGLMVTTGAGVGVQYVFQNYTGYHNVSGAWLEDRATVLAQSIVADNGSGVIVLRGVVDDVAVVGRSANTTPVPRMVASVSTDAQAGIQIAGSNHGGKRAPWIKKASIIDQADAGVLWDPDNLAPGAILGRVSYTNTPVRVLVKQPSRFEFSEPPNFALNDPYGLALGNGVPARIMMYDSTLFDPGCAASVTLSAVVCPASASLFVHASENLDLVEPGGQLAFLRYFDVGDPSMSERGSASFIGNGRRYEATGVPKNRLQLVFEEGAGKSVEIAFPSSAGPGRITQDGQAVTAAGSLSALRASAASGYFFDSVTGRLHVRYVGVAAAAQTWIVEAPFLAAVPVGRSADVLSANAVNGMDFTVTPNTASYQLRQALPNGAVSRSGRATLSTLSAPAFLRPSAAGDTTVIRGYVYAPENGLYRVGLWGSGGGTSIWVGDTFVMGEPWAFINSNDVLGNGELTQAASHIQVNRQIALRTGWHAVTVSHAKVPANREDNNLFLRWAAPSRPELWVYPEWKVAP